MWLRLRVLARGTLGHVVTDDALMTARLLSDRQAAVLRARPYSYGPVGTGMHATPVGFDRLERSRELSRRDFDAAARDLLLWRVHEKAGLGVRASDVPLRAGSVVLMRLGYGPLSLQAPCRVVELIDAPGRRGFTYGTLPGHPEAGEERFLLEQQDDGCIRFTITAFSTPASAWVKLMRPAARGLQLLMTQRYLRALDRL